MSAQVAVSGVRVKMSPSVNVEWLSDADVTININPAAKSSSMPHSMKFSTLTERIGGESVDVWQVHYDAMARVDAGEDVIVLSVGEQRDAVTPAPIVEAAVRSLRKGRHHYTPISGQDDLRLAVAAHYRARAAWADEHHCAIFAGAQNALFAVAQCLLEADDEVILSAPYYATYPATFGACAARLVPVAVRRENQLKVDPDEIVAAMTPATRAIVLNSPNNPLGSVIDDARYAPIVRACVERRVWLIIDEVYAELLHEHERANPYQFDGAREVCIGVSSVSKSHQMTGWRLGWAFAPPTLIAHLYNLSVCMAYGLPAFVQDAAQAALALTDAPAKQIRIELDRRQQLTRDAFAHCTRIELFAAPGGMFVVLDIGALHICANQFARRLLDDAGVSVLSCDGFGARGLLRLSLCVDDARLVEACRRICGFVDSL